MDGEWKSVRSSRAGKKGVKGSKARSAVEEARRREVLKETLREKLELERRALLVVERLLDDIVAEEFLIDCARMITPANYRDAVEERSIAKMCGYPVCPNKLTNVPSQQYKISTKTNKVYDITERKCFCSNFCYKASKCFEAQISKTPLWLRKEERPPDVKLMEQGDGGHSGVEVKLADRPVSEVEIENPNPEPTELCGDRLSESSDVEQDFVSSVVAKEKPKARVHWGRLPTRDERSEEEQPHEGRDDAKDSAASLKPTDFQSHPPLLDKALEETDKLLEEIALTDNFPSRDASADANADTKDSSLHISHVGMSKKSAAGLRNLLQSHVKTKTEAPSVKLSLLERLRMTLMEWRTEETMRFLYGPDYSSQTEPLIHSEEEEELDEDDLEDVVEKGKCSTGGQTRPSAAPPDYDQLRKEAELLELRVQEFYKGDFVLAEEVDVVKGSEDTKGGDKELPLPPVDSHAQRLIQKRIAVEKLSRGLRDIVGPLHVSMSEIINDINNLVRTFRFTNVNIIHKPPEWTLIAVVLLSVLTEISPLLKETMTTPSSVEYISSLMKELRLKDQDLQNLVLLFEPKGQKSSHACTENQPC